MLKDRLVHLPGAGHASGELHKVTGAKTDRLPLFRGDRHLPFQNQALLTLVVMPGKVLASQDQIGQERIANVSIVSGRQGLARRITR